MSYGTPSRRSTHTSDEINPYNSNTPTPRNQHNQNQNQNQNVSHSQHQAGQPSAISNSTESQSTTGANNKHEVQSSIAGAYTLVAVPPRRFEPQTNNNNGNGANMNNNGNGNEQEVINISNRGYSSVSNPNPSATHGVYATHHNMQHSIGGHSNQLSQHSLISDMNGITLHNSPSLGHQPRPEIRNNSLSPQQQNNNNNVNVNTNTNTNGQITNGTMPNLQLMDQNSISTLNDTQQPSPSANKNSAHAANGNLNVNVNVNNHSLPSILLNTQQLNVNNIHNVNNSVVSPPSNVLHQIALNNNPMYQTQIMQSKQYIMMNNKTPPANNGNGNQSNNGNLLGVNALDSIGVSVPISPPAIREITPSPEPPNNSPHNKQRNINILNQQAETAAMQLQKRRQLQQTKIALQQHNKYNSNIDRPSTPILETAADNLQSSTSMSPADASPVSTDNPNKPNHRIPKLPSKSKLVNIIKRKSQEKLSFTL